MLQIGFIRENINVVIAGLTKKNVKNPEGIVQELVNLDKARRELQSQTEALQAVSNQTAKTIGMLVQQNKKDEIEAIRQENVLQKTRLKMLADELDNAETQLTNLLMTLPNLPHGSVPEGRSADDNENIKEWGDIVQLPDSAKPHWDLISKYNLIDFELGNKITGAGFPVYKGKGARLQRGLINFFLDQAIQAGYQEVLPPILVNADSAYATGQLPDKEGQMYHDSADDLYLIPTAEVPITNMYRDVILNAATLPIAHAGYSPCFRREAGSWGAHVRGLNRLHQFDKVEIVQIAHPDNSYQILEQMLVYVESLLQKLHLPYRILRLCGADMSFASALTYDLEVWSAAQKRWLEVSSVSNFETFQANRLKLRSRSDVQGKPFLLHTLNGSALALPRIVAALLENNQTENGILMPEILHSYLGFSVIDLMSESRR